MLADFLSREPAWFGEEREGFRSSLDRSGLDTSGTVAHALFGDQQE